MNPPTVTSTPGNVEALSIVAPAQFAERNFEYPLAAAVPCLPNFYKVWESGSCPFCEAGSFFFFFLFIKDDVSKVWGFRVEDEAVRAEMVSC